MNRRSEDTSVKLANGRDTGSIIKKQKQRSPAPSIPTTGSSEAQNVRQNLAFTPSDGTCPDLALPPPLRVARPEMYNELYEFVDRIDYEIPYAHRMVLTRLLPHLRCPDTAQIFQQLDASELTKVIEVLIYGLVNSMSRPGQRSEGNQRLKVHVAMGPVLARLQSSPLNLFSVEC